MPAYDGPAELITQDGRGSLRVTAHLRSQPPTADRFGRWQGELLPDDGSEFDDPMNDDVVVIRLPSGRGARAVIKGRTAGPRPVLELVGSGPPPF